MSPSLCEGVNLIPVTVDPVAASGSSVPRRCCSRVRPVERPRARNRVLSGYGPAVGNALVVSSDCVDVAVVIRPCVRAYARCDA